MKEKFKTFFAALPMFFRKNAGYLLLFLCLGVTALAVALLVPGSSPKKENEPVGKQNDERLAEVTLNPHLTLRPSYRDALVSTPAPDFTPAPQGTPAPTHELLPAPVTGDIIWGFAINELIYSVTLDQWTTHSGVDIACKLGSPVRSVADGTVEKVYTDTGLGITVIIRHANGDSSVYANLAQDDKLVKEGETVKCNDEIAVTGNTAAFEAAQKAHLHFEYHKNDLPVNPSDYVMFVAGS